MCDVGRACLAAGRILLVDEIRQDECDAQLEGALVHRPVQQFLGLPEPIAHGVLMDAESFGRSAAAAVLIEVGPDRGGEATGGVVGGRQCAQLARDEIPGMVEVRGGQGAQRDVVVAGDAALAVCRQPCDALRFECLDMARSGNTDLHWGCLER